MKERLRIAADDRFDVLLVRAPHLGEPSYNDGDVGGRIFLPAEGGEIGRIRLGEKALLGAGSGAFYGAAAVLEAHRAAEGKVRAEGGKFPIISFPCE